MALERFVFIDMDWSDDDADTEDCVLVLLGQESPETDWIELHYSTFNARLRPTGARKHPATLTLKGLSHGHSPSRRPRSGIHFMHSPPYLMQGGLYAGIGALNLPPT